MKITVPVLALALAAAFPLTALAQTNAAPNGPPPDVRAQLDAARDAAKTASLNDLSPANRAKVQSIIDQINNGQQTDLRAAAQQIDAALTPAETKAVLAERDKLVQTMHANMPPRPDGIGPGGANVAPPNGTAPNGAPPSGAMNAEHPRGFGRHMKDAGGFLLMLGVSREKMRALHQRAREQMPASQKPQ